MYYYNRVNALAQALVLSLPLYAVGPGAETISADLLRVHLPTKAKEILLKAKRAADAGDHAGAIELLESACVKYPEADAWTKSTLGVEYLRTRQFEGAVVVLQQAILLLPRDSVDRSNLGVALANTGRYDQAEQELNRAVELDSTNVTARKLLVIVHERSAETTSSPQ
jgi:Flp pilus assembly protein TadD